jgi:hypothetical protein
VRPPQRSEPSEVMSGSLVPLFPDSTFSLRQSTHSTTPDPAVWNEKCSKNQHHPVSNGPRCVHASPASPSWAAFERHRSSYIVNRLDCVMAWSQFSLVKACREQKLAELQRSEILPAPNLPAGSNDSIRRDAKIRCAAYDTAIAIPQ